MKLHNLLLTAALFVSSAVAFAASEAVDYSDYSWYNESGKNTINVTLTQFDNQWGFTYAVYDVNEYNKVIEGKTFNSLKKEQEYAFAKLKDAGKIWNLTKPEHKNGSAVTKITLPSDKTKVTFGVICYNQDVTSVPNVSKNYYFYNLKDSPHNTVYYGFINGNEGGGNDKAAQVTFGAPLPAPVMTLLIALGFGAALVMYRNRKVKA